MKYFSTIACLLVFACSVRAQNQVPVISNFTFDTDIPNNSATLQYSLSDAENDPLEVSIQFSIDGGKNYATLSGANVSGDAGFPVATGNRSAICTGLNFTTPGKYAFRVVADDKQLFDIQALVNEVDSNRLKNDLLFVEGIRHRTSGLPHLNATRDSLQNLYNAAGLYFEKQTFAFGGTTGQNLIASLPGTSSAEKVVIADAHYDTVINAPGADDNGSGTVGMMEIARLLSRYPSKKTQRYIGFDLEESGLVGSLNYVASGIPAGEQIEGVFNFEMIGYWSDQPNTQTLPTGFSLLFPLQAQAVADNQYRGDFITNVGSANSQTLLQLFANAAQQYVPGLKVLSLSVPGNGQAVPDLRRSDHAPFWDSNRKALMLTNGANFRNTCYHTSCDTLEDKLNFTFMSNVVKATIAAMAQLVEVQHADWATASFELAVGILEPDPCSFKLLQDSGLAVQAEGCVAGEISIEFYDMKGSLMLQRRLELSNAVPVQLPTAQLPAGIYALKIRHNGGVYAQKVVIR